MAKKDTTKTKTSTAKKKVPAPKKTKKVVEEPIVKEEFSTDEILEEIKEEVAQSEPIIETTNAEEVTAQTNEPTTEVFTSGYIAPADPEWHKEQEELAKSGTISTSCYDPETGEGESHTYEYDKEKDDWVEPETGKTMFEDPENFTYIDATTMEGIEQREVVEDIGTPEEEPRVNTPKKTSGIKVGDGNKTVTRRKRNSIKLSTSQMHGHLIYNGGNFDY